MIRPAVEEDRSEVIKIVQATGNFNDEEIAIADELIDIYLHRPEQHDYFAYVYDDAGRVAGFLIVGPTPATTGTYDMYWIASHPEYYGKGVSQTLDRFAEEFVRSRGG